jgi:hypothetical protein
MGWWRSFLDSLDTNGGHLALLLLLIIIGGAFYVGVDATSGGQMISLSFGALLMALKSVGTNSEQIARAGAPWQPPQPPPAALTPQVIVGESTVRSATVTPVDTGVQ